MKNLFIIISMLLLSVFTSSSKLHSFDDKNENEINCNNQVENNNKKKMLLILAAPSIHDEYYKNHFHKIVEFQINYAKKVINNGSDEIRILADKYTKKFYSENLPENILINQKMHDIWMRDFTTVNPENPIQFIYTDASMSKKESIKTQNIFDKFADKYNLKRVKTDYIIDGGNIVDNYHGKIITTTRFLKDNNLEYKEAKKILKKLLNANQIAIIQPDDDLLAHADGMVSWIDDNVLAINDYLQIDPEFHKSLLNELKASFQDIKIVIIPVKFDEKNFADDTTNIKSACGINLNIVSTYENLYIPIFGNHYEKEAIQIIKDNTSKNIITINAKEVCLLGGSVRCMTWQLAGENINKF